MNNCQICNSLKVVDYGMLDYKRAWKIQKQHLHDVISGQDQVLIFCEHPSVITCGRSTKNNHILLSDAELQNKQIIAQHVDRGGDVTLHSPGQLVVYPIIDLKRSDCNLHAYLRNLEEVVIDLCAEFGIMANRSSGYTGVWIGNKKIVSIGIGVQRWTTYHGLAINVNNDLELFSFIKPCGLDISMTSISQIKKHWIDLKDVKAKFSQCFSRRFDLTMK